jgi:sugar fermentation stimulation protein A
MKGTYAIVMELPERARLKVGSLGTFDFPQGYYAYVGSAQRGIEQRVSRHMRREKPLRWHVDYLLARAEVVSRLLIPFGGKDMECVVAKTLIDVEGARIVARGFGSSDCRCESHLVYLGASEDAPRVLEEALSRLCTVESVYPYSVGP